MDPLICPNCQGEMRVISVTENEEVKKEIRLRRTSPQAIWSLDAGGPRAGHRARRHTRCFEARRGDRPYTVGTSNLCLFL